jgi:hypothetical protein
MRTDDEYRHACEVRWCVRNFWPSGDRIAAHLDLIAKRRGKAAADRLRADVREAWRAEMAAAREAA